MPSLKSKRKAPKPRNPQDTTLRNLRAIKARVDVLEQVVADLRERVDTLAYDAGHSR